MVWHGFVQFIFYLSIIRSPKSSHQGPADWSGWPHDAGEVQDADGPVQFMGKWVLRFFHGEQMADDCGSMDVIFNVFQSKSEIETPKDSDFPQKKGFLGTRDQQFFGDQERSSSRALLRRKHRGSGPDRGPVGWIIEDPAIFASDDPG